MLPICNLLVSKLKHKIDPTRAPTLDNRTLKGTATKSKQIP